MPRSPGDLGLSAVLPGELADGEVREILDQMAEVYRELRALFGFTHVGAVPRRNSYDPVVWGLGYPESSLFLCEPGRDTWRIRRIDREEWESLTELSPPWPWAEDGAGLRYEEAA